MTTGYHELGAYICSTFSLRAGIISTSALPRLKRFWGKAVTRSKRAAIKWYLRAWPGLDTRLRCPLCQPLRPINQNLPVGGLNEQQRVVHSNLPEIQEFQGQLNLPLLAKRSRAKGSKHTHKHTHRQHIRYVCSVIVLRLLCVCVFRANICISLAFA